MTCSYKTLYKISLIITLGFTDLTDAFFVSISDKSYPFINEVSSGLTLAWSYGNYAQLTRSSVALRVNERGVNFIHVGNIRDVMGSKHWDVHDCYDSTTSLCALKDGSRVFPFDRVNIAANRLLVSPEMSDIALEGCQHTRSSKRRISDQIYTYDISLCDVVDSRLDVLYLNMDNKVLFRRNTTSIWIYVLVSIVSVYLVSHIAQNVSTLLNHDSEVQTAIRPGWVFWVEAGAILAALIAILIPCLFEMVLVTDQEFFYCIFTISYVFLHSLYYAYKVFFMDDRSAMLTFNLITGTLLLLTQGVYHTIANPYSGILLLMLSLRCFYKLLETSEGKGTTFRALHTFFLLLDATLLILTHYLGLRPTFLFRFSADVSFVIMLLFSWVVCEFIVK